MKHKKLLVYLGSIFIPIFIFLACTFLNKFLPFGNELLNSYDSFTQYPGMLLEYAKLLKEGNIFYSWGAGLGFNFFGTLTYYCISPLNLLAIFATSSNYHLFITFMTLIRFGLLGASMCFYLNSKNIKPLYVILFSTIYALMGYTATYYYNYIWIDSVIMLPFVIYGLDRLIEGKSPATYIFTLAFTIMINYYIGYMICIFSLVWFAYNFIVNSIDKKLIKTFIISSLLAGLLASIVLLPSMFALLTGKAELYNSVSYFGINRNAISIFYTLTPGSYQNGDQMYGPGLIYSTIFVLVLTIFYFFNKKVSKKEKIATLAVLLFFYLSLSVNLLNYAWQFFQRPIWWQSRFAFMVSFFLITLGTKTLNDIESTELSIKKRMVILGVLIIGIIVGAFIKFQVANVPIQGYTYFFLFLSIMILIEEMFLLDRKGFMTMIVVVTFVELFLNTFNSLKNNFRYMSYTDYSYIKEEMPSLLYKLNQENDEFYRMEFIDDYSSNDGLYFGFNGINYFNSARNIRVINLMTKLGIKVSDQCHIRLSDFDPVILSLLNIKYLYGSKVEYLNKKYTRLYENKYPLAIGFMVDSNIKNFEFEDNKTLENRNELMKQLLASNEDYYKVADFKYFEQSKEDTAVYDYSFISDGHYIMTFANFSGKLTVNGEEEIIGVNKEITRGDKVKVSYSIVTKHKEEDIKVTLLDLDKYESAMGVLSQNILHAKENTNGHILDGHVVVPNDRTYLFTSVEYEDGMKVYVDGKRVEPDLILGALIGLELEEGKHEVYIDYVPKGLKAGTILSLFALASSIVYLQIRKKAL